MKIASVFALLVGVLLFGCVSSGNYSVNESTANSSNLNSSNLELNKISSSGVSSSGVSSSEVSFIDSESIREYGKPYAYVTLEEKKQHFDECFSNNSKAWVNNSINGVDMEVLFVKSCLSRVWYYDDFTYCNFVAEYVGDRYKCPSIQEFEACRSMAREFYKRVEANLLVNESTYCSVTGLFD